MDPNKAGEVVRRLGEASGTFPETYVKIQARLAIFFIYGPLGSLEGHFGT